MAGKQKKSGYEFTDFEVGRPGDTSPDRYPSASGQPARESEPWNEASGESSEFPISEGSDVSANQAIDAGNGGFQETLRQSAGEGKRRLTAAATRGYAAGSDALEDLEGEMSTRPWSTFLTGALLGGIAGYLIATRR
jgi:hypothetical protein